MKVLIWIGTLFVATLLNVLLGEATGIRAGGLLLSTSWRRSSAICGMPAIRRRIRALSGTARAAAQSWTATRNSAGPAASR